MEFVQAAVKRLGHDAVADPARGDDEDFFGHGGRVGLYCAILYRKPRRMGRRVRFDGVVVSRAGGRLKRRVEISGVMLTE